METLWTDCHRCGDVQVWARDLVRVPTRKWFSNGTRSNYQVTCPGCGSDIVRPTDALVEGYLVQTELAAATARPSVVQLPALEDRTGPALTVDDLLDFVVALRGTDEPLYELLGS